MYAALIGFGSAPFEVNDMYQTLLASLHICIKAKDDRKHNRDRADGFID